MPHRLMNRPIFNAFAAPVERLLDSPIYAKLLAGISGIAALVREDILFLILILLMAANLYDTMIGRAAASARGEPIDSHRARAGFLTKISGIAMICMVRVFEWWGAEQAIPGLAATDGAVSAAIAVTLFIMDLESIEGHRVALGARPIPIFSQLIRFFRTVEARLLVVSNPPPPEPEPEP